MFIHHELFTRVFTSKKGLQYLVIVLCVFDVLPELRPVQVDVRPATVCEHSLNILLSNARLLN